MIWTNGEKMEFTGERIIPGKVNADLLNEHICRYRFAQLLVKGKVVLDIGSGVGYGSKILAEKASSVVAIDLSEEAVRYANEEYAGDNIEMLVGDSRGLPLASDSVDVVVSFELIEHLHGQLAHLHEVNRVLKPNGLTVISTPNRIFYSQESNQTNPFHTREFDFQEFNTFLKSVFSCVEIYFQNHIAGLIIANPTLFQEVTAFLQEEMVDLQATSNFLVGVCTHGRNDQPPAGNYCLLPGSGNLLRERQQDIERLELEVAKLDSALTRLQGEYEERTGWALELNRQVKSRDDGLTLLRAEFEERSRRVEALSRQLEVSERALGKLQTEFEERSRWAEELSRRLEAKDKALGKLQTEFEERSRWVEALSRQLEVSERALGKLQTEFEERSRWAEELSRRLEAKDKALGKLQTEFEERSRWVEALSRQLEVSERALGKLQTEFEERSRWTEELSRRLEAKGKALGDLQSEFEDRTRWAKELSSQLTARDQAQLKLQSEFEDRTEWALRLDAEVRQVNAEVRQARLKLAAIRQSKLYRLATFLGWKLAV